MIPLPFTFCFGFEFINLFCVSCLKKNLQRLLKSWFGGAEFSQLLLVCKAFDSPSYLNEILAGYSNVGCRFFSFSLILTVASRLLHLYSTNDKTSRLMMESFSIVRVAWRGTQTYMEKRRGRREIEVTRRRRGIKRRERKLASNHFPMCSPQSGSLRDVHRVRGDKSEEGDRGCQEDKRQNQK